MLRMDEKRQFWVKGDVDGSLALLSLYEPSLDGAVASKPDWVQSSDFFNCRIMPGSHLQVQTYGILFGRPQVQRLGSGQVVVLPMAYAASTSSRLLTMETPAGLTTTPVASASTGFKTRASPTLEAWDRRIVAIVQAHEAAAVPSPIF